MNAQKNLQTNAQRGFGQGWKNQTQASTVTIETKKIDPYSFENKKLLYLHVIYSPNRLLRVAIMRLLLTMTEVQEFKS